MGQEKQNNYQRYKQRATQREKQRYRHLHDMALTHYAGENNDPRCLCCHIQANEFLHIADASGKSRQDVITKPDQYPDGLNILCWNCSHCMTMYGECIHQIPVSDF